jgi:hypothetical protein
MENVNRKRRVAGFVSDVVASDPAAAAAELASLRDETQLVIAEIRRLVYALRPRRSTAGCWRRCASMPATCPSPCRRSRQPSKSRPIESRSRRSPTWPGTPLPTRARYAWRRAHVDARTGRRGRRRMHDPERAARSSEHPFRWRSRDGRAAARPARRRPPVLPGGSSQRARRGRGDRGLGARRPRRGQPGNRTPARPQREDRCATTSRTSSRSCGSATAHARSSGRVKRDWAAGSRNSTATRRSRWAGKTRQM